MVTRQPCCREQRKEHGGDLFGAQVLADEWDTFRSAEDALDGADRASFVVVFLGLLAEGKGVIAAQGHDGCRPLTGCQRHDVIGPAVQRAGTFGQVQALVVGPRRAALVADMA